MTKPKSPWSYKIKSKKSKKLTKKQCASLKRTLKAVKKETKDLSKFGSEVKKRHTKYCK